MKENMVNLFHLKKQKWEMLYSLKCLLFNHKFNFLHFFSETKVSLVMVLWNPELTARGLGTKICGVSHHLVLASPSSVNTLSQKHRWVATEDRISMLTTYLLLYMNIGIYPASYTDIHIQEHITLTLEHTKNNEWNV